RAQDQLGGFTRQGNPGGLLGDLVRAMQGRDPATRTNAGNLRAKGSTSDWALDGRYGGSGARLSSAADGAVPSGDGRSADVQGVWRRAWAASEHRGWARWTLMVAPRRDKRCAGVGAGRRKGAHGALKTAQPALPAASRRAR